MWPGLDSQLRRQMWVEFVGSLLCTEWFSPGTPVSPLIKKPAFDLICVDHSFQFTVSPMSPPALERLDNKVPFLSFHYNIIIIIVIIAIIIIVTLLFVCPPTAKLILKSW